MLYLGIDQHKSELTVNLRGEDGSVILKRSGGTQRHHGLYGHAAFRVREIRCFCAAVSVRIFGGAGGL